ncbi:hypothetical protein UlMin_044377 [Ulmus minor]
MLSFHSAILPRVVGLWPASWPLVRFLLVEWVRLVNLQSKSRSFTRKIFELMIQYLIILIFSDIFHNLFLIWLELWRTLIRKMAKKTARFKPNCIFEHDKSVRAVVVGLDQYINFYKLQYGTLCIHENPGCLFIATNRDTVGHMTNLEEWPGTGCMVAAICSSTEKERIVVGKPSPFMMDFLLQKFDISCSRMCMVGDKLDTDILFRQNAGVTTLPNLQDPSNMIQPNY